MAIENTVSIDFLSTFLDSFGVFDGRLSGVRRLDLLMNMDQSFNMANWQPQVQNGSRGREFDPGPVPYFRGDWLWNNFYGHSSPFRWFEKGCCCYLYLNKILFPLTRTRVYTSIYACPTSLSGETLSWFNPGRPVPV